MAIGDTGGAILLITCKAHEPIKKGRAVELTGGDYGVMEAGPWPTVFGQATVDCEDGTAFPVKVRGVCVFDWAGYRPEIGAGVVGYFPGKVQSPIAGRAGSGTVLKVTDTQVHVLL